MPRYKIKHYKLVNDYYAGLVGELEVATRSDSGKKLSMLMVFSLISAMQQEIFLDLMKSKDYFLFEWALKNDNLNLFDKIFYKTPPEQRFLMIEFNSYQYLKEFVERFLKDDEQSYQLMLPTRKEMLLKILNVDFKALSQVLSDYCDKVIEGRLSKVQKQRIEYLKGIFLQQEENVSSKDYCYANTLFGTGAKKKKVSFVEPDAGNLVLTTKNK